MPIATIATAVIEIINLFEQRAAQGGEPVPDELLRAKQEIVNALADEANEL